MCIYVYIVCIYLCSNLQSVVHVYPVPRHALRVQSAQQLGEQLRGQLASGVRGAQRHFHAQRRVLHVTKQVGEELGLRRFLSNISRSVSVATWRIFHRVEHH